MMPAARASFAVVVPARRAAVRLPDKPLADVGGVPLIVRTLMQAAKSDAAQVVAAVDDEKVAAAVESAGFTVCMTGECESGSARVAEAARLCEIDEQMTVVNLQGDEPFMEPELINQVASLLAEKPDCVCATAMRVPRSLEEFLRPSAVKVVANADGTARFFSRLPIPYAQLHAENSNSTSQSLPSLARIHIGVYAYSHRFLRRMSSLPPSPLEEFEKLEQLRILWHGRNIALLEFDSQGIGIDTPEDLAEARLRFAK